MKAHGIAAARISVALSIGVVEIENAALADHGVVVEFLLQALPQPHGPFVEWDVSWQQIVGADNRGVTADIAASEPTLFQHGDVCNVVFLGQIEGGSQAMTTATDNDDVVSWLEIGVAPDGFPTGVAPQSLTDQR